jgi:hypothetical protein
MVSSRVAAESSSLLRKKSSPENSRLAREVGTVNQNLLMRAITTQVAGSITRDTAMELNAGTMAPSMTVSTMKARSRVLDHSSGLTVPTIRVSSQTT